jgi:signal peptidase I
MSFEREAQILTQRAQTLRNAALYLAMDAPEFVVESEKFKETIKVGDKVLLLPGGSKRTDATPPLVEGHVYTVEEIGQDNCRIQGPGSWVYHDEVELVSKYRPTIGDKVRLLPGEAERTNANPPLIEGNVYTIEEDDNSLCPYLLQGPGSWVQPKAIELVERGNFNDKN